MNNSDYAFFSFGDDESSKIESEVYKDYLRYMKAESELEDMIFDGVLDVYVDEDGSFHYKASKTTMMAFPPTVKANFTTFKTILEKYNLNINRYNRYKYMLRRMNP